MEYRSIELEKDGHVGKLTLNRPGVMNAIDEAMRAELTDALYQLESDSETHVLVITGAGNAFCGGADLHAFKAVYEEFRLTGRRPRFGGPELAQLFSRFPKPLIAAVNGVAVGWGMTMPLMCDIRIASHRATFSAPFVRVGLTPEFGSCHLLPRMIGYGRAADLFFTGRTIESAEALTIGLVDRLVPHEDLLTEALSLAAQIAAQPSQTMITTKALLRQGAGSSCRMDQWIDYEALVFQGCMASEEHYRSVTKLLAAMKRRDAATE